MIVGTKLVQDLDFAEQLFSILGDRVVAGIDSKKGLVAVHGWTETSDLEAVAFARRLEGIGCRRVIATDVATDGRLQGPNLDLMHAYVTGLGIPVIASGGVSNIMDVQSLIATKVEGVITGKALYEGRLSLSDAISIGESRDLP